MFQGRRWHGCQRRAYRMYSRRALKQHFLLSTRRNGEKSPNVDLLPTQNAVTKVGVHD